MKFVSGPDSFLLPTYRISPFITASLVENVKISEDYIDTFVDYCDTRFGEYNWVVTANGRDAINKALFLLGIRHSDEITILTTSNNSYISGCVTREIEKFCGWSREETEKTSVFLVNHEFGYPYTSMQKVLNKGIPVVEDCCTTFFSQNYNNNLGTLGAYGVFSFSKFFPIQIGGLLVGGGIRRNPKIGKILSLDEESIRYVMKVVGFWLTQKNEIIQKRKRIFEYAQNIYGSMGFSLRFESQSQVVPSALLLQNNGIIKDLPSHKSNLYQHGIQNSVFYGEDAFFIPCHQNLSLVDVDYFGFVTDNFIKKQ